MQASLSALGNHLTPTGISLPGVEGFFFFRFTGKSKCVYTRESQTVVVSRMCRERDCWFQSKKTEKTVFPLIGYLSPQKELRSL